jgi:Holliday junction resolvase RusA-like endonuclease
VTEQLSDDVIARLTLPYPPSTNKWLEPAGRGRGLRKTAVARQYREHVQWLLLDAGYSAVTATDEDVSVEVFAYRKSKRQDIDNISKALFDSMEGFIYINDNQIAHQEMWRLLDRKNPSRRSDCEAVP